MRRLLYKKITTIKIKGKSDELKMTRLEYLN